MCALLYYVTGLLSGVCQFHQFYRVLFYVNLSHLFFNTLVEVNSPKSLRL